MAILVGKKANDIVHAEMARNKIPAATDPNHDAGIFAGLQGAATTAGAREAPDHLSKRYGPEVVGDLLNKVVKNLLPNKTLQRVKRHLRREARNLVDMSAKQHIMHICRINTEEIACCPPAFDQNQCSTDDEIIDILLWNTPKCWQREMDPQGFDPPTKTVAEVAEFMERIEMSEDFDGNKKVAAAMKKGNNDKR